MAQILDFTGKPKQKAFFYDRANKTIGAGGGYNSGKSYAMLAKIQMLLEIFAGSQAIVGRKTYGALEKSVIPTFELIAKPRNGGDWNGPVISKFADMTVHYKNGSKLWFVTYDDVKKVRGPNIAYAGISQAEEVAHEIFLELKGRCRQWQEDNIAEFKRVHGERLEAEFGFVPEPFNQLMCEFNPAPNWVRDEFFFNENGANKFYDLPTSENKRYHAAGWLEDMKRSYTKENYDRFINGSWDVFGGMVYPDFDIKGLHGIPDMVIPSHWPRIIGWDHGYRNPTAVEGAAIDEMGNCVFYKEHYADNVLVKEHAAEFKRMASGDKFPVGNNEKFLVYMDYSAKNADGGGEGKTIWDEYNELGIFGLTPDKDIQAGVNMVKQYLKADPERPFPRWHPRAGQMGSPKLFIVQSACPNLVNEMQTYQWEETKEGSERNHQEKPKKWNDHACDASRYLILALGNRMADWIQPPPTPEKIGAIAAKAIAQSAFVDAKPQDEWQEEG